MFRTRSKTPGWVRLVSNRSNKSKQKHWYLWRLWEHGDAGAVHLVSQLTFTFIRRQLRNHSTLSLLSEMPQTLRDVQFPRFFHSLESYQERERFQIYSTLWRKHFSSELPNCSNHRRGTFRRIIQQFDKWVLQSIIQNSKCTNNTTNTEFQMHK